jgi:hypothetical protein
MRLTFGLAEGKWEDGNGISMVIWQVYTYVYKCLGLRGLT